MLAEKLGIPYQDALRHTTATEFLRWAEYFRKEEERKMKTVEKTDFYLAQLAAITCQVWGSGKGKRPTAKDFLIRFEDAPKAKSTVGQELTKEEWERRRNARAQTAKSFWMGRVMGTTKRQSKAKARKQVK